ncbi:MAG: hypothetical protein ABI041_09085, partial [Bdellovibrionia bacterium]
MSSAQPEETIENELILSVFNINNSSRPTPQLMELPPELIEQILDSSDTPSICNWMATCKIAYRFGCEHSKFLELWIRLYNQTIESLEVERLDLLAYYPFGIRLKNLTERIAVFKSGVSYLEALSSTDAREWTKYDLHLLMIRLNRSGIPESARKKSALISLIGSTAKKTVKIGSAIPMITAGYGMCFTGMALIASSAA